MGVLVLELVAFHSAGFLCEVESLFLSSSTMDKKVRGLGEEERQEN